MAGQRRAVKTKEKSVEGDSEIIVNKIDNLEEHGDDNNDDDGHVVHGTLSLGMANTDKVDMVTNDANIVIVIDYHQVHQAVSQGEQDTGEQRNFAVEKSFR